MNPLVTTLLDRWAPVTVPPGAKRDCAGNAAPPEAAHDLDVCRLCGRPMESSDTVAAGGDDVVHSLCYDRLLESPPASAD